MKHILTILTVVILLASCKTTNKHVFKTDPEGYNAFVTVKVDNKETALQNELKFWNDKYANSPNQWTYLVKSAGLNAALFDRTGDVQYLYKADEQLSKANNATHYANPSILRAISKNCITQHKFREALNYLSIADSIGSGKKATIKMLFDVYMELGDYAAAERHLEQIEQNSFDFHIRMAKWLDHKGQLNAAIQSMELASSEAERLKDDGLRLWSYSNLADFYGHNGQIEDAYDHYLKALELDSNYTYALKGIAWIIFSKERNYGESKRLAIHIKSNYDSPDINLLLSEISAFEGDSVMEFFYINEYELALQKVDYGNMYNTYNVALWAEQPNRVSEALYVATKEVKHRGTGETFSLLAWAQLQNGDKQAALNTIEQYVWQKTFEPMALYYAAEVFKSNGKYIEANQIKEDLAEAIYELGPQFEQKINAI